MISRSIISLGRAECTEVGAYPRRAEINRLPLENYIWNVSSLQRESWEVGGGGGALSPCANSYLGGDGYLTILSHAAAW